MLRSSRALFVATALVATGCKPAKKPPPVPECSAKKACTGGLVCVAGSCEPCSRDNQCARDEMCHPIKRRCVLRPCFGHECKVHDDCPLGEYCVQGLCLEPDVVTPDGCQVVSCANGESCNTGQKCNPVNLVCEEDLGCQEDSDCPTGEKCNVAAGECEAGCTAQNAATVCGVKKVCYESRCVDCVKPSDCGPGLSCDATTNLCVSQTSCISNRDCAPPLVCNQVTKECTVDPGPCLSAEDCGQNETCELSTGQCVPATCQPDRCDPNQTMATAAPLAQGLTPNLTLCQNEADYFKIALENGDELSVIIDVDPLLSFHVDILDGAGDVVGSGDLAADIVASVAGDYYVELTSQDAYVAYGIHATVARSIPCPADPGEPNEDFQHATALPVGDSYGFTICPGDVDYYAVAVQPGDTVQVELSSTPDNGLLTLTMYDSTGTHEIAQSSTTDPVQTVQATVVTGNRVYVEVAGSDPTVQNSYDLHVAVSAP